MRTALPIQLAVLLLTMTSGCCCSVASHGGKRVAAAMPSERQVLLDLTLVRIPEDRISAAHAAIAMPGSTPRDLAERDARHVLDIWAADDAIRVVQAPKLLGLDGQEATVFIGESLPFLNYKATTNPRGGLEFSVDEQPGSPVFIGFRLRATSTVGADGTSVSVDLVATRREAKREFPDEERSEMGVEGFLRDQVFESRLTAHHTVRDGGYVILGDPTVQEDGEGRHVLAGMLKVRVPAAADAAGYRIAQR